VIRFLLNRGLSVWHDFMGDEFVQARLCSLSWTTGFADVMAHALSHEIGLAQRLAHTALSYEHCAGLAKSRTAL
jgi:hypothetical protein